MDKYEYTIKSDKIKKLVERKDYETAVKIADTIDWERIKNVKMLSTVSQAYEKVGRFEDAKDILLMAYECAPVGRRFLYKLTELAVKQKQFDEAEVYLKEFAATSPQDPSRLILRYEIAQAKGEPTERLITILEAYQKREFEERWTYELASLYYKAGKNEECVKLCDEIVLWFGVGTYVDKAMELKQRIAPLTPDQIEKRENKEKYLRRLEDVRRKFEEKEKPKTEPAQNLSAQAEQAVSVEPAADAEADMSAGAPSEDSMMQDDADVETERLQAEMEASLAREIETAAMSATIDEAMLRPTAASMETVGAVNNDHSDESEKTKIAAGHFTEQTKTREFVLQARAINIALEEIQSRPVTPEDVETRMSAAPQPETTTEAVPQPEEVSEMASQSEEAGEAVPQPEVTSEAKSQQEEGTLPTESPQEEESTSANVRDHYVLISSDSEEKGLHECVSYIKRMRELLGCPTSQVARISGTKLAVKDMDKTLRKLQGRDLIVVGIADLPDTVLTQMINVMARDKTESFIALVDTEKEINGLRNRMAFFADCRVLTCEPEEAPAEAREEAAEEAAAETPDELPAHFSDREELLKEDGEEKHRTLADLVQEALRAGGLDAIKESQENGVQEAELQKETEEETGEETEEAVEETAEEQAEERKEQQIAEETEKEGCKDVLPQTPPTAFAVDEMTPNEFFEFAVNYARMLDAVIDDMAGLAVFAEIEQYQQDRILLTEELAQELVEKAILRAEKRSIRHLFTNRYDKEGYLILKEEHFRE